MSSQFSGEIEKKLKGKNVEKNEELTAKPLIIRWQGTLVTLEKSESDPGPPIRSITPIQLFQSRG